MGIKQVKDGCWTFADGDRVCYPFDTKFVEKVIFEIGTEGNASCNKTYSEFVECISNGANIVVVAEGGAWYPVNVFTEIYNAESGSTRMVISVVNVVNNTPNYMRIRYYPDGSIELS